MSETSQEQYIFELEQALEKLLAYFEVSDTGYKILEYGLDLNPENVEADLDVSHELASALEFAEKTLYGYTEID